MSKVLGPECGVFATKFIFPGQEAKLDDFFSVQHH